MSAHLDAYGQPVGHPLPGWTARPAPARVTLEGRFCRLEPLDAGRQALVYKDRSRDAAWYSVIDSEWPHVGKALREWLSPDNFGADGVQK
ncbi:hypothetical protein, partial [Streptomyces laurentii]|uniref:hypothetical protein n=1 Tax=Streptomyces laurentii TaxID=39478 RepID=UPI0036CF474A